MPKRSMSCLQRHDRGQLGARMDENPAIAQNPRFSALFGDTTRQVFAPFWACFGVVFTNSKHPHMIEILRNTVSLGSGFHREL